MFLCCSYQPVPLHGCLNRKHCSGEYSCQRVTACSSNETSSYFIKGGEGKHRNVTVKNYLSFYMITLCWIFKGQGEDCQFSCCITEMWCVYQCAFILAVDQQENEMAYFLLESKQLCKWSGLKQHLLLNFRALVCVAAVSFTEEVNFEVKSAYMTSLNHLIHYQDTWDTKIPEKFAMTCWYPMN